MKIKKKKKEMEDFFVCIKSVIRANNLCFKLKKENFEINKNFIYKEEKNILIKLDCSNLDEYFNKIKKIMNNKKYTNIYLNKEIETLNFDLNIKNYEKNLLSYFQKLLSFSLLRRNIIDKEYYLPCFIDNRGRQYYATLLSPTFYTIFRHIISFTEEKKFLNLKKSTFYKKILTYKYLISHLKFNEKKSYVVLVLLIEIGKFFVKTDDNFMVKTEEMIKSGLNNYNNQEKELKFKDQMYINIIKFNLQKLINEDQIDTNMMIFKDATASGLQNYGLILGFKKEKLKFLNLDGND